jgi:hypothetical protein
VDVSGGEKRGKMKRGLVVFGILTVSILAIPTNSQEVPVLGGHTVFQNARGLYNLCVSQSDALVGACQGYIQGVYDQMEGRNFHICLPSGKGVDLKNAFVSFMETHPGFMRPDQPATAAIAVAFACKQ